MLLILGLIILVLLLAYRGAGRTGWSLLLVSTLLVITFFSGTLLITVSVWLLGSALLLLLFNGTLRRRYLISPVMNGLRRALPPISNTEKAAIDAGTVGWEAELFNGTPQWQQLLQQPKPQLSAEEQAFLDGPVEQLCLKLDDWEIVQRSHNLSAETWTLLREQGFFAMIIPKKFGGKGFSALAHSSVVMKISSRSISAAVTVMVPNSLGPAELLLHYGTESQQQYYLPRLASGIEIPCFALTSADAGSDAGALSDSGIVTWGQWHGERVLGLRLNWSKRYITLAPVATLLGLAFKVFDPDGLLGEQQSLGITCALVPVDLEGVQIGDRHRPLTCAFMNGPTQGQEVFIPLEQIIGGRQQIGNGWSMLLNCLSVGRAISLPAQSCGAAKLASLSSGAYSRIRQQFNSPICDFEGVSEALASIAGLTYLMDSARTLTTAMVDRGEKPSVASAIIKYHNTEMMRTLVNQAMDIHGGRGVIDGPRNYLARVYQAVPIGITVEGANILTRNLMIFGQGSIRCHRFLLSEMEASANPDRAAGLLALDQALSGHLRHSAQLASRALLLGLTRGRLFATEGVPEPLQRYAQQLNRMSAAFALVSDCTLLTLGGTLKFKERISARLGDVLSHLYLASAVLKRYADDGMPAEDRPLLQWCMAYSLHKQQQGLIELLHNYPSGMLGGLLRLWIFPGGCHYRGPSDRLGQQAASCLLTDTPTRQRLIQGVFYSRDPLDPVGRVENAFQLTLANNAVEQRLQQAQRDGALKQGPITPALLQQAIAAGLLNETEERHYLQTLAAVDDAIQVDHYRPAKKFQP
ncbi:MAG: acyl-CoA dehydrogenase [Motiliproteus sp.]|jgi:acyl-CoA dehydrogenase